jgi:hypothetical protein
MVTIATTRIIGLDLFVERQRLEHWIDQRTLKGYNPSKNSRDPSEKSAGKWYDHMQKLYKKGYLSPHHIETLEATDGWTWADTFSTRFQSLIYKRTQKSYEPSTIHL